MSSRAITSTVIKDLFDFNNQPRYRSVEAYKAFCHQDGVTGTWGGPRARLLVHAVVTIAFSCLLRIDETLNLRAKDVTILRTECISINLPQRKTNPYGGMTLRLLQFTGSHSDFKFRYKTVCSLAVG